MSGHYSQYLPDGSAILSGHEVILQRVGNRIEPVLERGQPLVGSKPCPLGPFGGRFFAFNPGGSQGPRVFDRVHGLSSPVYDHELSELAAGGSVIAGRSAAENCLVVIHYGEDEPVRRIPGAGQPSVAADGRVHYRVGDDKNWPMACLTAEAFDNFHGRIMARRRGESVWRDVTVGDEEFRPFLFDFEGLPCTLVMTRTGLRARPLFPEDGSAEGWPAPPERVGEDRNILAHGVVIGTTLKAVWQSADGREQILHDFDLASPPVLLRPVVVPVPAPQPPPPTPEPDPMPPTLEHLLRDRTALVKRLRRELFGIPDDQPLEDPRKALQLTRAVATALADEGWGIVRAKAGSENNVDGYTADVIAQRDGEHVDVVADGEGDGFAVWQPVRFKAGWQQAWNDAIAPRWEAVTGGDGPDPGDEDDGGADLPPAVPVRDPRLQLVHTSALALARALALLEPVACPPCELPHNSPCERPHDGVQLTADYDTARRVLTEANQAYRAAQRSMGDRQPENLHGELAAHLTWRLVVEGFTAEQVIEEARRRGRGEA